MKSFLLLIGFVAIVFGQSASQSTCQYTSSGGNYYDLSSLSTPTFYVVETDSNGFENLYFSICAPLSANGDCITSLGESCCEGSAACLFSTNGVNIGNWEDSLFSDLVGSDQGVEIIYSSPNSTCDETGKKYKTSVRLVCDWDAAYSISSVENPTACDTIITVNTSAACPVYVGGSIGYIGESGVITVSRRVCFKTIGIIAAVVVGLCLCCVCCCVRRRRCMMRRRLQQQQQTAAVELTNVSFRSSQPTQQIPQVPMPQYIQYVQQTPNGPQYFYVQPQQQQQQQQIQPQQFQPQQFQPQQFPIVVPHDQQLNADEKLARVLQAQFNQE